MLKPPPYLLIDFSDAVQTNLYKLGSTYMKLVKTLFIKNISLIDPSIYLHRFCSKLEFGEKTL